MPALSGRTTVPIAGLGVLGVAFALYTQIVGLGAAAQLDLRVARALQPLWQPGLEPLLQVVAVLGGVEVTGLLAIGLAVYLRRRGFGWEALALLALPVLLALEVLYKRLLLHPPPLDFSHPDGPSVVTIFHGGTLAFGGSYPSGHIMRTVLIYGLCAFVVRRLAPPGWATRAAVPAAAIVVGLMTLDRVFLGVHWQSDVMGGLLLGGAALAGAIAWMERPRTVA